LESAINACQNLFAPVASSTEFWGNYFGSKAIVCPFCWTEIPKASATCLKGTTNSPLYGKTGLSNLTFPLSVSISQEKALTFTHCPFRLAVTIHSVFARFVSKAT
jgi:hypothetical protein